MRIINWIVWALTGFPLYFAGISAGAAAAIGAGVSAAGSIAGGMISSSGAKGAAKTQEQAAMMAAEQLRLAGEEANKTLKAEYEKNADQILKNYGIAREDLAQYAGLGGGAANQLATMLGIQNTYDKPVLKLPEKPVFKYGGTYNGLKIPAGVDYEAFKEIVDKAADNFSATHGGESIYDEEVYKETKSQLNKRWADQAKRYTELKTKRYQEEVKKAEAAYKSQLAAWNKKQQAPKPGNYGELMKTFTAADYMKDPTTGGKAPIDLTRNFALEDYKKDLITGGKAPRDLTRDFSLKDFKVDPGYAFRQQQGNLGVERSAAARGSQLSGATMKALQRFNQNLASDEYGRAFDRYNINRQNAANVFSDVFNRFNINRQNAANVYGDVFNRFTGQNLNKFNMLSSMLGQGQTAAAGRANINQAMSNQITGASQNYANTTSQNLLNAAGSQAGYRTDAAAANAAGQIGSANAWNQAIGGVTNSLMDYGALRSSSNRTPSYMTSRNYGGW